MSGVQIASLAGLLGVAAVIGLVLGLRQIPPGETALIEAQAALYFAETGGAATDCYARPSAMPGVRLVVICENAAGDVWARAVDRFGTVVEDAAGALGGAPLS